MRINDAQSRSWTVEGVGRSAEAERVAGAEAAQTGAAVKVSLSERARALAAQGSPAVSGEAFDAAKVERLRAEIANGSFSVDPGAIARKMLDEG